MNKASSLEKAIQALPREGVSLKPTAPQQEVAIPSISRRTPLLLLAALLAFAPLLDGGTTHLAVMVIRLLIVGMGLACLWSMGHGAPLPVRQASWLMPALGFLTVAGLSAFTSPNVHQSRQWLMVLLLYAALFYFIVFCLTRWNHVRSVVLWLVAAGVGESVWALYQFGWLNQLRPSGTFFNPNFLSGYLAAIGVMTLAMGLFAKKGGRSCLATMYAGDPHGGRGVLGSGGRLSWSLTALWAVAVLVMLSAMVITGSRGAVMALSAGTAVVLLGRYRVRGLAIVVALLIGLLLIPNPLRSRFEAEHAINPVAYARMNMWMQAGHIIAEHPFGIGFGLYQYIYPQHAFPVEGEIARYGKVAQTPHNEYLQIGVELGIPGLLLFCWGLIRVGQAGFAALRLRLSRMHRGLLVGVAGAAVSLLAHAAVDSNLHEPAIAILLVLCLAVLFNAQSLAAARAVSLPSLGHPTHHGWLVGGAVSLLWLAAGAIQTGTAWMAFEQGAQAQRAGQLDAAMEHYRSAIRIDVDKALYHSALAAAHFQRFRQTGSGDDAQRATDELTDAIRCNPLDGRLQGLLGHLYASLADAMQTGQGVELKRESLRRSAVEAYQVARTLEPFVAMHRLELGRLYWSLGERQRGIEEVAQASAMEPNFLPARAWLVQAYLTSESPADREQARREFQEIQDRQRRYAAMPKNELETLYLSADIAGLKARLERGGPVS